MAAGGRLINIGILFTNRKLSSIHSVSVYEEEGQSQRIQLRRKKIKDSEKSGARVSLRRLRRLTWTKTFRKRSLLSLLFPQSMNYTERLARKVHSLTRTSEMTQEAKRKKKVIWRLKHAISFQFYSF